ncbi:MAG: Uma2 family endonuclease [Chloroflexi bacterium]|nr:Uma2 family endonuclease [Chloroflexota bacterium]
MTSQNIAAAPPVSLEEYAALPKHPRYELVKGALVELMVASEEHEHTGSLVVIRIGNHVLLNRLGRVYLSNRGYVTGPDSPATSRMPDVSFVSNARLAQPDLSGMLYDGAPDLAVEILSESNTASEIAQKIREYLNAGGKAVWVIDIDARTLTVHTAGAPPLTLADADSVDGGDYLPGFACAVADMLPARSG